MYAISGCLCYRCSICTCSLQKLYNAGGGGGGGNGIRNPPVNRERTRSILQITEKAQRCAATKGGAGVKRYRRKEFQAPVPRFDFRCFLESRLCSSCLFGEEPEQWLVIKPNYPPTLKKGCLDKKRYKEGRG